MIDTTQPKHPEKISKRPLELLVVVDKEFRIQSASQSFYYFFDETHKSAKGKTIDQVSAEEQSFQTLEERYQVELQNPDYVEGLGIELGKVTLSNKELWVTARQLLLKDMRPNLVLLIFQEDKESEASANKLLMLDDKEAFDMQVILDENLQVLSANQRYYEFFDTSNRTTEGRALQRLGAHQWDIPQLTDLLEEVITDKQPFQGFEVDYDFPRIGRKSLRLKAQTLVKFDGEPDLVLLTMEDLTEQKEIEREIKQLRSSRERYEVIFNSTYQFTGLLDRTGMVLDANKTALDFAGTTIDDVLDKRLWETTWFREEDYKQIRQSVKRAAAGKLVRHELNILGQGQQEITIDFSLKPDFNKKGRVRWIIAEGRDITEKKQMERELEESREEALRNGEMLNRVVNHVGLGIKYMKAIRDSAGQLVDFKFVQLNQQAKELLFSLETTDKEVIGGRLLELLPEVGQTNFENYKQVLETGENLETETQYEHSQGQQWFHRIVIKLGDGVVVTSENITSRKQRELELKRNKRLIDSVYETASAGIDALTAQRDAQGKIVDFVYERTNLKSREIKQQPDFDFTGKTLLSLFPGVKTDGLFEKYAAVVETGEAYHEIIYYGHEHLRVWVDLTATKWDDGIIMTLVDVTEQKLVEEQAKESAELIETVFNSSEAVLQHYEAVQDKDSNIVDFVYVKTNQKALEMANLPLDTDLAGKRLLEVHPGVKETGVFDLLKEVTTTGEPVQRAFNYNQEGIDKWFQGNYRKLGDGVMVTITDITKLAKTEQLLRHRTEELEATNQELSSFTYSISHDLRTPLRAITGFANMLLKRNYDQLDSEGRRLLRVVTENVNRMAKLISDLLQFSHLGKKSMKANTLHLRPMFEQTFEELNVVYEKRANLQMHDLPTVKGDRDMIRQLVENLLSNAIKFSSKNENPQIEVGEQSSNDMHIIYVRDNGVGFDPQYYDKLFEVFQRLHRDDEFEGTGVGLAIVQKIVHRHGGKVWAESQSGQGTTFYFSIPKK